MSINKDTLKAIEAGTTLIKYCARYKTCKGCIFHKISNDCGCVVNRPYLYDEIKLDFRRSYAKPTGEECKQHKRKGV